MFVMRNQNLPCQSDARANQNPGIQPVPIRTPGYIPSDWLTTVSFTGKQFFKLLPRGAHIVFIGSHTLFSLASATLSKSDWLEEEI